MISTDSPSPLDDLTKKKKQKNENKKITATVF